MSDKERRDRFYAFVRKANHAGVTVQPQRGARQHMISLPEGSLFLGPEVVAIETFIRFSTDSEIRPGTDFLNTLLHLRTDLTDLAGEGRVTWQDLFATSSTISLGEWLVQQGSDLPALLGEIRRKREEADQKARTASVQTLLEKPREERIKEAREALEEALISEKYGGMSIRSQCKYGESMQQGVREAVGRVFTEDQLLRFHELYAVVLAREQRRIANMSEDALEAEARSCGSDMPPADFMIARDEALETFYQEQSEAMDRFEDVYSGFSDENMRD